ncbi:MAG: hypothetical protein Q7K28_02350 [Candidatus Wildermuthbacteria bacterium]|nr:hypothetical protein [Candidatus Wildermuthbacteria bacterium]
MGTKEQEKNFTLRIDRVPLTLEAKIPEKAPDNAITSVIQGSDVYYLDNFGFIYKTDSSFGPKLKISQIPFPVQSETEYNLKVFENFIFLEEGDTLHLLNKESLSFEKFFEGVKGIKISPDDKKLAIFSNSEIWILFLRDAPDQPQKKAAEFLFLARFSEKIGDIFWLDENYLIFNAEDKIKIAETDDRDSVQIWSIKSPAGPRILFNEADKKLYILNDKNLYSSEKLNY